METARGGGRESRELTAPEAGTTSLGFCLLVVILVSGLRYWVLLCCLPPWTGQSSAPSRSFAGSQGPRMEGMAWVLCESSTLSRLQRAPLQNERGCLRGPKDMTLWKFLVFLPPAFSFQNHQLPFQQSSPLCWFSPSSASSVSALKQTDKPLDRAPPSFSPLPLVPMLPLRLVCSLTPLL